MPNFFDQFVSGTVGGVVGMAVVYPLDTIKSRMQTFPRSRYPGPTAVLTSMVEKEGAMSLYRGLLSPVAGYGTLFAIIFSSYGFAGREMLRRRGGEKGGRLTLPEVGVAGAFAGVANGPFRQVFERIKSVMQVRMGDKLKAPYSWSGACAMDLIRREGIVMGLGRGMGATMIREPIQFAIYYPTYEFVKNLLICPDRANQISAVVSSAPEPALQMLAGGVAGCAMWLPPVYTLDVLKTRMQTAEPGVYRGTWDCAKRAWRADGLQILYRGLSPSLMRAFPLHSLIFLGYETTIAFLAKRPEIAVA